jgi:hypothetical protein
MDIGEEQAQLESIRRGFAEIEAGHYIPHEAMKDWLVSLGSQHELPAPNCVCGKPHDEPSMKGRTEGRAFRPAGQGSNRNRGFSP